MDHVEFDRDPPTNLTTMVMAYGGWIDAGQAATGALRHLVRDLSATRVARIDQDRGEPRRLQPQRRGRAHQAAADDEIGPGLHRFRLIGSKDRIRYPFDTAEARA